MAFQAGLSAKSADPDQFCDAKLLGIRANRGTQSVVAQCHVLVPARVSA